MDLRHVSTLNDKSSDWQDGQANFAGGIDIWIETATSRVGGGGYDSWCFRGVVFDV